MQASRTQGPMLITAFHSAHTKTHMKTCRYKWKGLMWQSWEHLNHYPFMWKTPTPLHGIKTQKCVLCCFFLSDHLIPLSCNHWHRALLSLPAFVWVEPPLCRIPASPAPLLSSHGPGHGCSWEKTEPAKHKQVEETIPEKGGQICCSFLCICVCALCVCAKGWQAESLLRRSSESSQALGSMLPRIHMFNEALLHIQTYTFQENWCVICLCNES